MDAPLPISVSVVIPTYNERANVERIVNRVLHSLSEYQTEVLVVDDDSPDETWQVAEQTFADEDRVRVIRRVDERGLATAVSRGFHEASHDACAVIDADLQHPPERLPDLLAAIQSGADIAIGSRHVSDGGIENWPRYRKAVSWGATKFAQIAVPEARHISDPMSGFFAVRREVVEDVELTPRGYKILLELLAKCDYERVDEVPYIFRERERGESKLTATEYQAFVEHILVLSVLSYGLSHLISPTRAVRAIEFGGIGLLGAGVNTAVFTGIHLSIGAHYFIAGIAAFFAAVNWNFLGNWLITFDRPDGGLLGQYLRFNAVSVAGFLMYTIALATCIQLFSIHAVLANLIAIAWAAVFNYAGSETLAFSADSNANPRK